MAETLDPQNKAEFDHYARSYHDMHTSSVALSGESAEYFAIYKQNVLERLLGRGFGQPVLDFGCGIGNLTRLLTQSFPIVHGYDPSADSAGLARQRAPAATFFDDPEKLPKNHYGASILANVLHHVAPARRKGLIEVVTRSLATGGRLVIFEHNPLNPITRLAVGACPFDENAELLYPWTTRRLLRDAGLQDISLDYIVFFPRPLAKMRSLEPRMGWLPLGAQVCAWGTKR